MDIVERLRVIAEFKNRHEKLDSQNIIHEAADEILRLRRDVEEADARAYVMAKEVTLWQSRAALKEGE